MVEPGEEDRRGCEEHRQDPGHQEDGGDNAGGYAALTLAPPDREVLTVEYKVNFLAPAFGEKQVAPGEGVTAGRRLFVCEAEVSAVDGDEERVCAAVLQTVSLSFVDTANP